jgi:hypothetical protein
LTESEEAREALKFRLRQAVADGLAPEARVRVTQLVFGPYSPFPVAFRVMGPDPDTLRDIAAPALAVMHASPLMRTTNSDWGERVPTLHFSLDQDRLQSIGLTSNDVARQLQFLLSGTPITDVREDIRSVQVVARSAGNARLDPSRIADFTLVGAAGQRVPLSQIGAIEIHMEDPILRRRDRTPTITVRGDIAEGLQPPDVSTAVWKELQPVIAKLPLGYRIEEGGSIEESGKANRKKGKRGGFGNYQKRDRVIGDPAIAQAQLTGLKSISTGSERYERPKQGGNGCRAIRKDYFVSPDDSARIRQCPYGAAKIRPSARKKRGGILDHDRSKLASASATGGVPIFMMRSPGFIPDFSAGLPGNT